MLRFALSTPKDLTLQIYVFGGGDTSQLTNQYPGEKKAPVPLENFTDVTVLDVQAAGYHTALLVEEKGKNKLITWGCNGIV